MSTPNEKGIGDLLWVLINFNVCVKKIAGGNNVNYGSIEKP